jgi:hypothetical protein
VTVTGSRGDLPCQHVTRARFCSRMLCAHALMAQGRDLASEFDFRVLNQGIGGTMLVSLEPILGCDLRVVDLGGSFTFRREGWLST